MTLTIQHLDTSDAGFDVQLSELLQLDAAVDESIEHTVSEIIAAVRQRGDTAVLEYTQQLDKVNAKSVADLEIPHSELKSAWDQLPAEQRNSLEYAATRIRSYHEKQKTHSWEFTDDAGATLGQHVTALDRVGLYVPGGRAAYPSSVLMNAIPARVAGVGELIATCPTPAGEKNQLVLAAAYLAGIDRMFAVGGAQAIAALAYGTQTITQVDKIVGPGNAYVASAKRRVFGTVGIDMVAGPSEVLIVADTSAHPDWVAMDMFAQAEHDDLAQSILLCPDADFIKRVDSSINTLLPQMSRHKIIAAALNKRGALIKVRDLPEAIHLVNRIAPEHLELAVESPRKWLSDIRHAGAIFLGEYTSEALGDYCAGPNHVLPTARSARFSSPLGVYDFQKRSSLIEIPPTTAKELAPVAEMLANGESLTAHARAAAMRR